MKCLVVDDEMLAREVIEHHIRKTATLQLAGSYGSALQAFAHLSREAVDLIFLDIKMPEINGLEFIRTIKSQTRIILTTAFHEYALEGFELDVTDYLLKPVSFERFTRAVAKVQAGMQPAPAVAAATAGEFYVKSDRKLVRVEPQEIIYIEGMKNYLTIHTTTQKIMVHNTMGHIETELAPSRDILRVHKSFLVNRNFIRELDGNMIKLSTGTEIPLGGMYRESFLNAMRII